MIFFLYYLEMPLLESRLRLLSHVHRNAREKVSLIQVEGTKKGR